jgi:hypothetical protein
MDGSTAQGHAGGQGGFEPTPQIIDMASTEELVEAIYRLIASSATPIPVTLMNDGVDETAAIIGAVVERCARDNIALTEIFLDPDLAELRTAAARVQAVGSMRLWTWASSAFSRGLNESRCDDA